jgi:hypothetical protein
MANDVSRGARGSMSKVNRGARGSRSKVSRGARGSMRKPYQRQFTVLPALLLCISTIFRLLLSKIRPLSH